MIKNQSIDKKMIRSTFKIGKKINRSIDLLTLFDKFARLEDQAMEHKDILSQLEKDGIMVLQDFVEPSELNRMQQAFNKRLENLSFNSTQGYQRYEMYRDYVEDLLLCDQSFMRFAVNPRLINIIKDYVSQDAILKECRGWRTRIVKKKFHGWHKDGWYDKKIHLTPPKQLKAVIYLTDVDSGSFSYIRGSHKSIKANPKVLHEHFNDAFIETNKNDIVYTPGKAGTVIIFDTSGIHCQSSPNLSPRHAAFYTYHSPTVSIDASELEYGRYGPLLINNAIIDDTFTLDDLKIIGFFQKEYGCIGEQLLTRNPVLSSIVRTELEMSIYLHEYVFSFFERVSNKLKKVSSKLILNKAKDN